MNTLPAPTLKLPVNLKFANPYFNKKPGFEPRKVKSGTPVQISLAPDVGAFFRPEHMHWEAILQHDLEFAAESETVDVTATVENDRIHNKEQCELLLKALFGYRMIRVMTCIYEIHTLSTTENLPKGFMPAILSPLPFISHPRGLAT